MNKEAVIIQQKQEENYGTLSEESKLTRILV
jgi:hypothetical protein